MAHQQAKALVWDERAAHHWTVWIGVNGPGIVIWCSDCGDEAVFPRCKAHEVRQFVEMAGDVQVVTWVEVPLDGSAARRVDGMGIAPEARARAAKESYASSPARSGR